MNKSRTVNCPRCGASVEWSPKARFRPFCSERCKMIDLGAWATGQYRVATPAPAEPDEPRPEGEGGAE